MGINDIGLIVLVIFVVVSVLDALNHFIPFDLIVVHNLDPLLRGWIRVYEALSKWVVMHDGTITCNRNIAGMHVVVVHSQDSEYLLSIAV